MKWGNADFKELKMLSQKVSQADITRLHEDLLKELAARVLRQTKKNTPVDTGVLRHNWQVGKVVKIGQVYKIEIFNPIEYAPYIEYGHRTAQGIGFVQGRFMLTIAERDIRQKSNAIIEKRISEFLEGVMK